MSRRPRRILRLTGALAAAALLAWCGRAGAEEPAVPAQVDFVRDIQPIFAQHCYECHGPSKQRARLRWDAKPAAMRGGQSGLAVVPGHSGDSRLIRRVLGLGGEERMPEGKEPLSDRQIALLKAWIDQGAVWPDSASAADATVAEHWAYVKPIRPPLPEVKDAKWGRNPIDAFVLARLEKQNLHPSPEADRPTLIRRASLDLIGLPPTLGEVDDFINDTRPDAYERVVERLLASPHYGERWARPWLDLARYADSNGYERDRLRSMWPYRDWVIRALNANMPFDQFTVEQLAGDLLPNATPDQRIATGFHRNTMLNDEAGTDPNEYYYYAVVDRANTTATVWLGSTLNCAQCHNHKYDPFTQRDYYRLLAYFNNTAPEAVAVTGSEINDISPRVKVDPPELKALRRQVATLKEKLNDATPELVAAQAEWERQLAAKAGAWAPLEVVEAKVESTGSTTTLARQPDGSLLATGASPAKATYVVTATTPLTGITAVRLEVLPDDSLPHQGPGRGPESGNFVLTGLDVSAAPADGRASPVPVSLKKASADFTQDGWRVAGLVGAESNESKPKKASEKSADKNGPGATGWAIHPRGGQAHSAVFETGGKVGYDGGTRLTFTLRQDSPFAQHTIGRFRLWVTTTSPAPPADALPPDVAAALALPAKLRSPTEAAAVAAHFRSVTPLLKPLRDQVAEVEKKIAAYPATSLVMQELAEPRETHIHPRGAFLATGEKVDPGVPAIFGKVSSGGRPTRLDLARWLASGDNPLAARVTMNRVWSQYFGHGIVRTTEDFGTQGDPPTHPELLDWLAVEFMDPSTRSARAGQAGDEGNSSVPALSERSESKWDLKHMYRLIVTSATYRQRSAATHELVEIDPENKLLARGPRFRLEAEIIRDQALAVGGLLSHKVGGPPVFPLQPEGVWAVPYSGEQWRTSEGEDRFRRSVYTFLRRTNPYPQFTTFDMAGRESACPRRSRTNTPLQALTTLNDPAFLQPAAALARRTLTEGGSDVESRATFAFRTALARKPEPAELKRLVTLYEQMREKYAADPKAAEELAKSAALPPAPKEMPPADLAAWTIVSNVLLNLDETLTKN